MGVNIILSGNGSELDVSYRLPNRMLLFDKIKFIIGTQTYGKATYNYNGFLMSKTKLFNINYTVVDVGIRLGPDVKSGGTTLSGPQFAFRFSLVYEF